MRTCESVLRNRRSIFMLMPLLMSKLMVSIMLAMLGAFSPPAFAEIYKCVVNGKTTFSDSTCGDNAKVIEMEVSPRSKPSVDSGMMNQKMKAITKELSHDRRKREVESGIERQERDIERLRKKHNAQIKKLDKALAQAKSDYNRSWSNSSAQYKRDDYYDRKEALRNEIKETNRRYYDELRSAKGKLSRLRKEQRQLR